MPLTEERAAHGSLAVAGLWELVGPDFRFGGYSALVPLPGSRLLAHSDSGQRLEFWQQDDGTFAHRFSSAPDSGDKRLNDFEGGAADPKSGRQWYSLEMANTIRRYAQDGSYEGEIAPPAMARFPQNGGAEALARLPDGRFIVLQEVARWPHMMNRVGLLFPGDPLLGGAPIEFTIRPPAGYDPADAVALPDGQVLILLRALRPTRHGLFSSRIIVADPADIAEGQVWPWRELANLDELLPRENYEGMTAVSDRGRTILWIVSDSNRSGFVQRTLLAKLEWNECAAAQAADCIGVRPPQRPS
ncbi:esterase-like activity of phytase family protein [Tsuneonella sp. HG222]